MGTLKDEAKMSGPKTVADLDKLELSKMEVLNGSGEDSAGKAYSYRYVLFEDREYRVPPSVLTQIKTLLEKNEALAFVKVEKSGEGLKTNYTVKAL